MADKYCLFIYYNIIIFICFLCRSQRTHLILYESLVNPTKLGRKKKQYVTTNLKVEMKVKKLFFFMYLSIQVLNSNSS